MSAPLPRSAFPRALATERLMLRAAESGDAPLYARLLAAAYATRSPGTLQPGMADAFGTFRRRALGALRLRISVTG